MEAQFATLRIVIYVVVAISAVVMAIGFFTLRSSADSKDRAVAIIGAILSVISIGALVYSVMTMPSTATYAGVATLAGLIIIIIIYRFFRRPGP